MPPDSLPEAPATVTDDGAAQAVLEAAEEKADEEEIAPAINENTAEKMEEEIICCNDTLVTGWLKPICL